ncbi:MAG TPA: hypothetical protein VI391_06700 [Thermoanaerobaculia bacterium]
MRDWKPVAFLVLLITILFADVIFLGTDFYARDVALQYYPMRRVIHDIVHSGSFPFWNPRISAGQPLAANPGYELFYPFQWLILLPDFDFGFRLTIVLHFYLAAIGTFLLLRSLGTRVPAAFFGAMAFVLGGTFLSLTNLLPFLFSATWLPWIAFFWRRANIPMTALSLGMLLLAADQSMILQAGALLVAYAVYRGNLKRAIVVIALASVVAAVQLVPALDLQRDSVRSKPLPYSLASSWSLGPQRPLEIVFPNIESWFSPELTLVWSRRTHPQFPAPLIFNYYPGLLAAVLIIAGFIARAPGWKFVAAWTLFSYAISVYPLIYILGLRSIRYPEKFFVSAMFVLTIFAALIFDHLDEVRRVALAICGTIGTVAIAFWVLSHTQLYARLFANVWHESNPLFLTASRRGWLLAFGISAVLQLLLFIRARAVFLLLFVLADLGIRIGGLAPRIERDYYDPPAIAQTIPQGARIYNDAVWMRDRVQLPAATLRQRWWALRNGMIPRMEEIWGYEGAFEPDLDLTNLLPTAELTRMFLSAPAAQKPAMLAMAGVNAVALLQPRDPNASTDPREYSYTRFAPFPGAGKFQFSGRIVRAAEHPNAVDVDLEAPITSPITIAISRHKYWTASIDGVPAQITPANIAFQSIRIPPGRHHIALRYRNPLIVIFGAVSLAAFVALLAAHFVAEHRRRGRDVEGLDAA